MRCSAQACSSITDGATVDGSSIPTDDHATYQTDMTRYLGQELVNTQLQYLFGNLTEDAAGLIVKLNEAKNGFETWKQLQESVEMPGKAIAS